MVEIVWNKNIEPNNKAEIEKYLTPFIFLIPGWVQKITVTLGEASESGNLAAMRARFQYREIDLDICPEWFTRTNTIKRDAVIHELCHIFNYQLFDFADRLIEKFVEDEKAKELLQDELTRYLEGGNQDLTFVIDRKLSITATGKLKNAK